jgi:PAS domain S-box-containing protein
MDMSPPSDDDRMYRLLMSAMTDYAIFMLDPCGHIVSWDAGAQRAEGYTADEILGQHFSVFFTVEDRRLRRPEEALAVAHRDGRCESEGWRLRKDGSRFWAFAVLDAIYGERGEVIGFAKITRDMTARREAEQARLETERRFRLLVEGVTDYAIIMLDPDGYVENWNPGATRIKGYAACEIIGEHFSRFYTDQDRAAGVPELALREATATGRFEGAGWRLRQDGNRFWASVVIDAIHGDDGELIGFAKVTRDLTEQRNTQRLLDETRERAAQSEKLESLGWVTSGVAHDFNNLLQIISSSAALATALSQGNSKLIGVLGGIEQTVARGALITRQLLTFARQTPNNPEIVDTSGSIQRAMDLFSRSLRSDIMVARELGDNLWPMRIDIAQFEAALLNIIVNAHDAMPGGGVLTVGAANTSLNGEPDGLSGAFMAVSVRDTGDGIPPEVLSRILEPFFTTKPAGKGTGLGLSQVHGFVRQAGGTVAITSEVNRGTVVTMLLPAVPDAKGSEPYRPSE